MAQIRNQFLKVSITLSIISILITLWINIKIAKVYLNSDGKTQALFFTEFTFGYQYYIVLIGMISLIFALYSLGKSKKLLSIFLSLLAILFVFVRIWRLFV